MQTCLVDFLETDLSHWAIELSTKLSERKNPDYALRVPTSVSMQNENMENKLLMVDTTLCTRIQYWGGMELKYKVLYWESNVWRQ
jgi:hypothetical protein